MMKGFDFEAYLRRLYPRTSYEVQELAGGLVNFTVRARRQAAGGGSLSAVAGDGDGAPPTLVLKQAPPYVAVVGDTAPFSQERQLVEAAVLRLFSTGAPLAPLKNEIRIPRMLSHDTDLFVLALEDLGPLVTLRELFTPASIAQSVMDRRVLAARCADIGRRVGAFFAQLHGVRAEDIRRHVDQQVVKLWESPASSSVVLESAVLPILSKLQEAGGFSAAAARTLYSRVERDYEREPYPLEPCFAMGDFHPGCILVPPICDWGEARSAVSVSIIDWEFAALCGRGVNGDMAQFLASLHCLLLSLPTRSPTREAVWAFAESMCTSYASYGQLAARMADLSADSPAAGIFRSALILLGRETINQAVDMEWESGNKSVKEMVEAGAWYLERAGESVEDMLEKRNWSELLQGEAVPLASILFSLRPRRKEKKE